MKISKNIFVLSCIATIRLLLRRTLVRSVRYSAFISRKEAKVSQRRKGSLNYHFVPYGIKSLRLCVKPFFILCVIISLWLNSSAQQNTENNYRKTLKEVLNDIQKQYGVQIKYDEKMVADKFVNYADWRYRTDVEATLDNILSLFDMAVFIRSIAVRIPFIRYGS